MPNLTIKPDFIKTETDRNGNFKKEVVVSSLLAKYVREHTQMIIVRDNCHESKQIYVYKDGRYVPYDSDMFKGHIKGFIENYNPELVSMTQVNEAFNQINTDINYVSRENLNSDEEIINFANGILEISENSLTMTPHDPSYLSTIQIPCNWTGSPSPTPVFDQFLDDLTGGNENIKLLLLEYMGYIISNINGKRPKKALFMIGPGNTGKSQLKNLTERIIGLENCIGIDLKEIEARFGTGAIYGTRLAGSSDMSYLSIRELNTFKQITGGDQIFAEYKGQSAFHYTYSGLLWFCANRLPKFSGDDGDWVYDRIMVVNCNNVIPKEKQDRLLIDKMFEEREGIVYKCIRALQRVIADDYRFSEPEEILVNRKMYVKQNNSAIQFFSECMQRRKGRLCNALTITQVYHIYKKWCNDCCGIPKRMIEFENDICNHLNVPKESILIKENKGFVFENYEVTDEIVQEYHDDSFLYFLDRNRYLSSISNNHDDNSNANAENDEDDEIPF